MGQFAEYEIRIYNPKAAGDRPHEIGHVNHEPRIEDGGLLRPLDRRERNEYRTGRILANRGDLDFEKDHGAVSRFIYILPKSSDWTFDSLPIREKGGGLEGVRISSRVAVFDVPAMPNNSIVEYELRYIDENGVRQTHDPIISNGSIPPSLSPAARESLGEIGWADEE